MGELVTGTTSDITVSGTGYILTQDSTGSMFLIKGGKLSVSADGQLKIDDKYSLYSSIRASDTDQLTIDADGRVSNKLDGKTLGRLDIVSVYGGDAVSGRVVSADEVVSNGGQIQASGEDMFEVHHGFRQGSGADITEQMVNLTMLKQQYFSASKVLTHASDYREQLNSLLER